MEEKARILIVDDDKSLSKTLSLVLEKKGYYTQWAGTGKEALAKAKESAFNVALIDLRLPDTNGVELVEPLKKLNPNTALMVVTGYASLDTSVQAVDKGVYAYLIKPLNMDEVLQRVEDILTRQGLIEEKQQAEQALRQKTEQQEILLSSIPASIYFKDSALKLIAANRAFAEMVHTPIDQLPGKDAHDLFPKEEAEKFHSDDRKVMESGKAMMNIEEEFTDAEGKTRWASSSKVPYFEESGEVAGMVGITADITERKEAEERIRRLLDQQVAINELSSALGEEQALDSIYHTIYEHVSRMMDVQAFIVSFYEGETNLIRAGYVLHEGQQLDTGSFPPIPLEEKGHGTQSQVIRTGKPLYFPNYDMARIETKPRTAYDVTVSDEATQTEQATQEKGRSSPNKSVLYVPMKIESEVIGVIQVQSQRMEAYSKDDEELLAGLASVAAIAIQNRRLNTKVLADAAKLRAAFRGTIEALAHATEIRDPYTAGHQMRVAELASAIAEELRLPAETLESIQVSGMVHDIGKLGVPAEILSKPSRLSETEYHLIQEHVQTAYDILRPIEFPWPIAQIVLQHHERMDGSGYPNGLKGEEILLEARMLAVADVVEAMSSHRPYRPALGIDKALEEITKNKGRLYDPKVVDACLKLFAGGRFTFEP